VIEGKSGQYEQFLEEPPTKYNYNLTLPLLITRFMLKGDFGRPWQSLEGEA